MQKRFDLVFSYWIFIWALLYKLKITKYNPKLLLLLGIAENMVVLVFMILFNSSYTNIFYFIIINIFIKIIPYYQLRKTRITYDDIYASIVVFLIYCLWLYINDIEVIKYEKKVIYSLVHNKNQTPGLYFLHKIFK